MTTRTPNDAGSINALLSRDEHLAPLLPKVERLIALQRALTDVVPPQLAHVCRVTNLKREVLTLEAPSNAAAAKLKQFEPALLAAFCKLSPDVNSIRVDVQLRQLKAADRPYRAVRTLGRNAVSELEQLANRLPASRLRDAMQELARKGDVPPEKD